MQDTALLRFALELQLIADGKTAPLDFSRSQFERMRARTVSAIRAPRPRIRDRFDDAAAVVQEDDVDRRAHPESVQHRTPRKPYAVIVVDGLFTQETDDASRFVICALNVRRDDAALRRVA
jgi:hypothetical protein